ncbi:xanthine dehydrogenase family protein molybdopterin-binding subunit [Actinomadura alba]|uniref:Xanthine dehydrogenase family protein molybdopterin-binding subunit n=1 Tax=Actinomadura alba TaxID=406431 RepID=A0ABR7LNI0_9ACTN|nr:xanthine dehydrogenase family protein molybdopterin-binding subunit [Actinomadura alba]MBC6466233.1 xanthine dehydrogenase family protein molybdopterin-binding subunit [Actinomadura alba]
MVTSSPGRSVDRVDGAAKVTGAAKYAADNRLPGIVHGHLVTSTIARGTIRSMDVRAARAAAGVIAVYTPADPLRLLPPQNPIIQIAGEARRPLQDREVRYHGQIIGLVVAETFEQARDAAALVRVTYRPHGDPLRASFAEAARDAVIPDPPWSQPVYFRADGVTPIDQALANSQVTVSATYDQPPKQHNAMEPHSAVAMWEGGRLTVYSGTQGPALHALEIAEALGVDKRNVHVISPYVGGGFGGKVVTWAPTLLAAAAARALGRPVKVVTTREQLFTVTGHRTEFTQQVTLGASRDGRLNAVKHEGVSNMLIENPTRVVGELYDSPNLHLVTRIATMDVPKTTIMRAPGYEAGSFALECAMDEMAGELGMDPVELRTKNDLTTSYPLPEASERLPFSSRHLKECYQVGARRFGWSRRRAEPRAVTDGDRLVGMGMASGVLPASQFVAAARVRFRANGTVNVASANADLGTGALTALAILGADSLGIPVDRVKPALGTSLLPVNWEGDAMMGAAGSAGTTTLASAVHTAARDAIKALIAHAVAHEASPFHGMDTEDVHYERGVLTAGAKSTPFGRLLTTTRTGGIEATTVAELKEEADRYAFASYAAYFCEVRVDRWTGEARLSRMTTVVDAGAIVNAKTARSQIVGGIIMSLGQALLEDARLEADTGRIANANLADYLLPVNADVPPLDVHFLDHPDTNYNHAGVRGLGELSSVGAAAAIANAVYNATGVRVRQLPITPDKLI